MEAASTAGAAPADSAAPAAEGAVSAAAAAAAAAELDAVEHRKKALPWEGPFFDKKRSAGLRAGQDGRAMKRYFLFDLDGTIADNGEGILKSAQYALDAFGIHNEPEERLRRFVGPPLHQSFMEF